MLLGLLLLLLSLAVKSEDQHCMDKATKEIRVEVGVDNAQRVMTYVRDEPYYQKNLQCKWILKAEDYDMPRQMYIQVPVVDFDTNPNICNSSNIDVLSLMQKVNESYLRRDRWCSASSVSRSFRFVPIRRQIINSWDVMYNLTLEFWSDNEQVRSDAKGVQIDVQVLGRDYCHRHMLYLDNYCYQVTPEPLSSDQFNDVALNYLGNFFTVREASTQQDLENFLFRFTKQNQDRKDKFPFESPLSLTNLKVRTGYFVDGSSFGKAPAIYYRDPMDNCTVKQVDVTRDFLTGCNTSSPSVALEWLSNGNAKFFCVPESERMPALIQFSQIPLTKGDLHPQLFTTCDSLPPPTTPTPPPTSAVPPFSNTITVVVIAIILIIVVAITSNHY